MDGIFTFHETARGHFHVMRGIPCEDYSESYSDIEGKYYIAIVADGHGAIECYRSNVGSRLVCEVTLGCLKEFAEANTKDETTEERFYNDILTNVRYQTMAIRQLTDTIIARWSDRVFEYHHKNPLTIEEKELLESKYDENQIQAISQNVLHIYGTTMMAALQLRGCIVLLHQGDGRLNVIYNDGAIVQPVPWDVRCEDMFTTSMCDSDAATSIRSKIIDLKEQDVVGCLLGCDGVEDAYRDTYEDLGGSHCLLGGVKAFYKDIICQIASLSTEEFLLFLKDYLRVFSAKGRFSRSGSGDDVSIAGIIDLEGIKPLIAQYSVDIKRYSLEEELFLKENEIRGKTRKHSILKKRLTEAEDSYKCIKERMDGINHTLMRLREKRVFWNGEITRSEEEYQLAEAELLKMQTAYETAKRNFEEYDENYQRISSDCQRISEEIRALE